MMIFSRGRVRRAFARATVFCLAVLALMFSTTEHGHAKLDPYYILRAEGFEGLRPRILIAVDTSGSMASLVSTWDGCDWDECETDDADVESRMHSARRAIKAVVEATRDNASFALMTFGAAPPPTSSAELPTPCSVGGTASDSCSGKCGSWSNSWPCNCDSACSTYGDCCDDYYATCNTAWSCSGKCGNWSNSWNCNCDSWCGYYGDCCPDYSDICFGDDDDDDDVSEGDHRFIWVTEANHAGDHSDWDDIPNPTGGEGTWNLCGANLPYPYLRYDNLLHGYNVANGADLPDGPLSQYVSEDDFAHEDNAQRLVQWFPRFLGERFNLDDCTDGSANAAIVDASMGDYGDESDNEARRNAVCGNDFYYWPFVDGFIGYSYNHLKAETASDFTDCGMYLSGGYPAQDAPDDCNVMSDKVYHSAGVAGRTEDEDASLIAPFYLESAQDDASIPEAEKGPSSKEDATDLVLGLTSKQISGGLDGAYGTPWRDAVGDANDYVTKNTDGTLTADDVTVSNGAFEHSTIASYLAYVATAGEADLCVPTLAILITDGEPSEIDSTLYTNLSRLRTTLGVKTYVVGFGTSGTTLQRMACAAAGSSNTSSPCSATSNDYEWDTCHDPDNHSSDCAYLASDPDELVSALTVIVNDATDLPVQTGPGGSVNEFGEEGQVQTNVRAYTETPEFYGHVLRTACEAEEDYCDAAEDEIETEEAEVFDGGGTEDGSTGCNRSRQWDAGECLQNKLWTARRLYTNTAENQLIRINESDGTATTLFKNELSSLGLTEEGEEQEGADAVVEFLLGKDAPENWKLPGLANSAPTVVRRIPAPVDDIAPAVGIRDPHCAGRHLDHADDVPSSLRTFASEAWELTEATSEFATHYAYQEAVLVGDDLGVLHAFHLDSGNELFGYIPRFMLSHAKTLSAGNPNTYGQSDGVENHQFGVAATVNQGWVFDHEAEVWRHLAVFGMGAGGAEYVALDVSHMGQLEADTPLDVLWTTESASDEAYDAGLGQTWSRPALTYTVPNQDISQEPYAWLVFGSGYPDSDTDYRGQTLFFVDALTGQVDDGREAFVPAPSHDLYDETVDYGLVADNVVGSHCLSKFWGEAQETYIADTAGRIFRWDLESDGAGTSFSHAADSGGSWQENNDVAMPLSWGEDDDSQDYFRACQGTDSLSCTIASGNRGDVFVYPPAVVTYNRLDEIDDPSDLTSADKDQFLLALISGSAYDGAIDGGDEDNDFHSSIYVLVDDHREDASAGLDVPGIGGATEAGEHSKFARYPLSTITRTRNWTYPDGTEGSSTRVFSKGTRPIRQPQIRVTGLVDEQGDIVPGVEVMYITFAVYELGDQSCDEHWYDAETEAWQVDPGSSYEIRFRITVADEFDLINGAAISGDYGDGFGEAGGGLAGPIVEQIVEGDCEGGLCGPFVGTSGNAPCDPDDSESGGSGAPITVPLSWTEIEGFSPLEVELTE